MQSTRSSSILLIVSVVATLLIWLPSAQSAPKYSVLHAFGKGKDGAGLWGSLLLDRKGNVYGTTTAGGSYGGGIVFELTSKTHGKWTETILHNFDGSDGDGSDGALLFDPAGNLYGTTTRGGAHGYGTVFELTPESGDWMETILHSFDPNDKGGCCPYAGIVIDASSNLYGTTGAVFKLSLSPGGWTETILHDFTCRHDDGCEPFSGVIRDGAGNLFGTTEHGGSSKNCDAGCGIVYQAKPMSGGKWRETIVHSFGGSGDGAFPGVGALTLDQSGNVYGTTDVGGPAGYGTVFKLTPKANGRWKETILHSFPQGANGDHVSAGVVFDRAGNLYGTTIAGGTQCDCGVVYMLAPGAKGKWTYTVLHRFNGYDGAQPDANLIIDNRGNLYGTTATGGSGGAGVAFEVTP